MRRIVAVVLHVYTSVLSNALECHRIRTAFFFFPIVNNREACIDCSLCAKVCPMENMVESDYPHTFYGAYNTNKTDIVNSSSGGIYPSLAKWIISQGGIVFLEHH